MSLLNKNLILLTLVLGVSLPGLAGKKTPAEKKLERAKTELALEEEATSLEKQCGYVPKIEIDWKSFDKVKDHNYSISGYCENIFSVLRSHCEGEKKKAYLQKNATHLVCKLKKKKDKVKVTKGKKGKVTYEFSFEDGNLTDKLRKETLRSL